MSVEISLTLLAIFAILAGVRIATLIGRDGVVHYAADAVSQAKADTRKLQQKLGLTGRTAIRRARTSAIDMEFICAKGPASRNRIVPEPKQWSSHA